MFVDGGFAQVVENRLTILTQQAVKPDDIDAEAAKQTLAEVQEWGDENLAGHLRRSLDAILARLEGGSDDVSKLYYELLYEVANKVPGETRHDSAKRIIHEHENRPGDFFAYWQKASDD